MSFKYIFRFFASVAGPAVYYYFTIFITKHGDFLFNIQSDVVEKNNWFRYLSMSAYFLFFLLMIWVIHIKQPFTYQIQNTTKGFAFSALISGAIILAKHKIRAICFCTICVWVVFRLFILPVILMSRHIRWYMIFIRR